MQATASVLLHTPDVWQTKVEEYVSWKMGPAVKTMTEYKALSADDKKDAKFWIVDTDGWCYWSHPLAKDEQTTLLLDAATLKKAPKGDLYYAIHSTMQAVDKENLGYWAADASDDAKNDFFPNINDGNPVIPMIRVTDLSVTPNSLTFTNDTPKKITATITPDDATDPSLTWTSTNTDVAIVDSEGNVTAVGQGTANIIVRTNDGSGLKKTVSVNVPSWTAITSFTLEHNSISNNNTFYGNESVTLSAGNISPTNATDKTIKWTSSDPNIATVENNKLVAKKDGTVTITAQLGKIIRSETYTISPQGLTFQLGKEYATPLNWVTLHKEGNSYLVMADKPLKNPPSITTANATNAVAQEQALSNYVKSLLTPEELSLVQPQDLYSGLTGSVIASDLIAQYPKLGSATSAFLEPHINQADNSVLPLYCVISGLYNMSNNVQGIPSRESSVHTRFIADFMRKHFASFSTVYYMRMMFDSTTTFVKPDIWNSPSAEPGECLQKLEVITGSETGTKVTYPVMWITMPE